MKNNMIIDSEGNEYHAWFREEGKLIFDEDNEYGIKFAIGIKYSDEQKKQFLRIKELKKYLKDTDFRALKYADGAYTKEEYRPYKEARAAARAEINEIEAVFQEPTLTRAEIDKAEALAIAKIREGENANSKLANSTNSN